MVMILISLSLLIGLLKDLRIALSVKKNLGAIAGDYVD